MQKDDRYYTFLLTRPFVSKNNIKLVKISKKWLHLYVVTAFLLSIISTGIFTSNGFDVSYLIKVNAQNQNETISQQISFSQQNSAPKVKKFNYERVVSPNSGGPAVPLQLTSTESEVDDNALEAQLRILETTGNREFLPTIWAHSGKINNEYGFRRNPFGGGSYEFHPGLDIDGNKGDTVIAPAKGVVVKAGWQGGYGNLIEIDHGNGLTTRYGHLSKIGVQIGDTVERGQLIGLVGSTGRSTGPHLHYEIRFADRAINPRRFLPAEMPS